jgi:hypothetical protein
MRKEVLGEEGVQEDLNDTRAERIQTGKRVTDAGRHID